MHEIYSLAELGKTELESPETHFPGITAIESAHRIFLTTTPRYERFMSGESIEEWTGLLGIDVLSLGHAYSTEDVTIQFMECNDREGLQTTAAEKLALRVASRIHDFGEIKDDVGGIGDISHDKKQDTHREQESVVFHRLLGKHVLDRIEAHFLSQIYGNIVHGDKSKGLARQFNAIERIGYLLTAHMAFGGVGGQRVRNWKGLGGNVLSNQTVALIGYANEFPMVRNIMGLLNEDITAMFDATTSQPPIIDNEGTLSFDEGKLMEAHKAWREYTPS